MSAMSASPVKPVLPSTGVNVPPPVATSPPDVGMPIPATLSIAPSSPANLKGIALPLRLVSDHKLHPHLQNHPSQNHPSQNHPSQNHPSQNHPLPNQPGLPSAMQPISQPLPRTPEKPKDLTAPVAMTMKPTANGMEGIVPPNQPNQPSSGVPAVADVQISAVPPPPQKVETLPVPAVQQNNTPQTQALPGTLVEPSPASTAPLVEHEVGKKEELAPAKPTEGVAEAPNSAIAAPQPQPSPTTAPQPQEARTATTTTTVSTPGPTAPTQTTAPTTATAGPSPATTPAQTPQTEQPVTPSVSRTEVNLPHTKPEMKVATIPRQATKRKREPKLQVAPETPEVKKDGKDDDRKSKRVRLPTQPYQSPLPELNIIAKINKSSKSTPSKAADDKLIVFYKNEFLAVRNADGGFYVCQAMQNIYKSSPRIRIRWLSQEEGKDTYSPDFYDHTDFDCILTNLNLDRLDKEKFRLPTEEQQRTESILKRALDVEKGVSEKPPVTEEHPDGLDLSLFRDESQLKKSSKTKGKKSPKSDGEESSDEDEEEIEAEEDEEKEVKKKTAPKTSKRKKKSAKKKAPPPSDKKVATKTATSNNKSTVQPAKKKTETRVGSKRKSSVSSNTQPTEKKTRKSDASSQPSDRTNKTRSVEVAAGAKSRRDRRAKSRK